MKLSLSIFVAGPSPCSSIIPHKGAYGTQILWWDPNTEDDPNTILVYTMFTSGNQSITLSVAQPSLYVEKERKNVAHVTLYRAPVGPEY